MDKEKLRNNMNDPEAIPGVICKIADVSPLEVTADDMKMINKYTLSRVTADDVFTFKAVIADNEQDDRNCMPFDLKALRDLKKLYPGKTMLKDHWRSADTQIARIYDTELIQDAEKQTENGEIHTELVAKIYMIKTDSNRDLIAEIIGGIKKEVSTSCTPEKMICNICGTDNMMKYCSHYPGYHYTIQDGTPNGTRKRCKMLLSGAKDAYELSFVAVPAQPRAGTHKAVGFTKPVPEQETAEPETETKDVTEPETETKNEESEIVLKARIMDSFLYAENKEECTNE